MHKRRVQHPRAVVIKNSPLECCCCTDEIFIARASVPWWRDSHALARGSTTRPERSEVSCCCAVPSCGTSYLCMLQVEFNALLCTDATYTYGVPRLRPTVCGFLSRDGFRRFLGRFCECWIFFRDRDFSVRAEFMKKNALWWKLMLNFEEFFLFKLIIRHHS